MGPSTPALRSWWLAFLMAAATSVLAFAVESFRVLLAALMLFAVAALLVTPSAPGGSSAVTDATLVAAGTLVVVLSVFPLSRSSCGPRSSSQPRPRSWRR